MSVKQTASQNPIASILIRPARAFSLSATLALALASMLGSTSALHAQTPQANTNANGREAPITYSQTPPGANGADITQQPAPLSLNPGPLQYGIQSNGQGSAAGTGGMLNILYPDPTQYVLSTGDLINVRLYGIQDYYSTVRISKDGTVQLPLLQPLNLAGVTIRQAQDLIASALKSGGMFRNPEIIIGIVESSSPPTVTFAGEKSGVYPLTAQRSLLDVIAASGGLPSTASRIVSVIRPGVDEPILVNLGNTPQQMVKANIPILPHDTIFVERSGVVYMLGAFHTPGAYPLPATGMTLMQASSLAGGTLYAGKYDDLRLVRTNGAERTEVKVDIKRIQYGQDPDPLLQPGDILFLPTTPLKRVLAANGLGTLIGAVSVLLIAIYQGR